MDFAADIAAWLSVHYGWVFLAAILIFPCVTIAIALAKRSRWESVLIACSRPAIRVVFKPPETKISIRDIVDHSPGNASGHIGMQLTDNSTFTVYKRAILRWSRPRLSVGVDWTVFYTDHWTTRTLQIPDALIGRFNLLMGSFPTTTIFAKSLVMRAPTGKVLSIENHGEFSKVELVDGNGATLTLEADGIYELQPLSS